MRLLVLLGFLVFFSPPPQETVVEWSPQSRLTWEDFKGDPETQTDAAATTVSALSYRFQGYMQGPELIYEYHVKALFFPEKSWVRPELKDEELLLHEQLHFDITAWYAIKLKQAFDTIRPVKDPKEKIAAVYNTIRKELDSVQDRYDRETDFSRNTQEQLLWQSRVRTYLKNAYD
ncbi:DUF922 domain-containing protein [Robertkochia marina]|uniref:DUF922 domain-containing protein n=1 Tax=Robertkochia marina TaxID=1227945 RepID=A0A4S3LXT0_9FLAO|nr:DUF922 domain-containing protein [Robertkochia marina]THD65721.1 DUF922 domain-containing protein [Robertkochia marina]TRZ46594.1 DUF922 domain-containing protein [Robertkochia marina]